MIEELAPQYGYSPEEINIEVIGTKPGEKMYEELLSLEETRRTWELPRYFVILPAFRGLYRRIKYDYPEIISKEIDQPYHSGNETPLTKKQISLFLREHKLLEEDGGSSLPSEGYRM